MGTIWPDQKIIIKLTVINGLQVQEQFSKKITVKQLKKHIQSNYYQELKPEQTVLLLNGKILLQNEQFRYDLQQIQIVQKKAQLWEIQSIRSQKDIQDPISCQIGVGFLSCDHFISKSGIRSTIKHQATVQKLSQIKCPFPTCHRVITRQQYLLIGGYDVSEMNEISSQLSENWVHQNSLTCPSCNNKFQSMKTKDRRIPCPVCKKIFFCSHCHQEWKGQNKKVCSSQKCIQSIKIVTQAPLTRIFNLKKKWTDLSSQKIYVPAFRACPLCANVVNNVKGCKHTPCSCKPNQPYCFCFVCLSICDGNKWQCGRYSQHCGKVAPRQTLKDILEI